VADIRVREKDINLSTPMLASSIYSNYYCMRCSPDSRTLCAKYGK